MSLVSHNLKAFYPIWVGFSLENIAIQILMSTTTAQIIRPGSNAVLHMSRTQYNQLGSCEVRRLTQLSSTDFIWSG